MTSLHDADDADGTAPKPAPATARSAGMGSRSLKLAVAVNPRAAFGGHRKNTTGQIGETVVEMLRQGGHEVKVLRRRNYAELQDSVIAELDAGAQGLIVVGGDGMVHLGVNALAGRNVPLGIIPAGTGNDAARGLGLDPGNPEAAVERFLTACKGAPKLVDVGRINRGTDAPVRFMCAVSAGFDALVNERANGWSWPRGPFRYTLAILWELMALKPLHYELEVDGEHRTVEAALISIANGSSIGGGMKITPDAKYDDGKLDLFIVSPVGRLKFLRIYPLVYSGGHTGHPLVSIERVDSVRISSPGLVAYADGERMGPLPLQIAVEPGALRVWL